MRLRASGIAADFKRDGAVLFEGALTAADLARMEDGCAAPPAEVAGLRLFGRPDLAAALGPVDAIAASVLKANAWPVRAVLFHKTAANDWSLAWHQDRTIAVRRRLEAEGYGPSSTTRRRLRRPVGRGSCAATSYGRPSRAGSCAWALFSADRLSRLADPARRGRAEAITAGLHDLADEVHNTDVGARYAQALFELADAAGTLAAVEGDLKAMTALLAESADLRRLVGSPAFTAEDKGRGLAAVTAAAGLQPLTRKFVGLVSANGRAQALPAMIAAFERLAAARRGTVAAEVITAVALTDDQARGVAAALRQALGRDPEVTATVDPAILGGIRVRVGSRVFDASLRSRLDHLKFALKRA